MKCGTLTLSPLVAKGNAYSRNVEQLPPGGEREMQIIEWIAVGAPGFSGLDAQTSSLIPHQS